MSEQLKEVSSENVALDQQITQNEILPEVEVPVVSEEFKDVIEGFNIETEVAKKEELKAKAVEVIGHQIDSLDESKVEQFLADFNEAYGDAFKDQPLLLLSFNREKVVIVNDEGKLEQLTINPDNAKELLGKVKSMDKEVHGESYNLRREIMKRSFGSISSCEAFTYAEELPQGSELWDYLNEPDNWLPERRELHQLIVDKEYALAQQLSERLGDEDPTIYILRGNTAAGKTTAVRNNATFSKALDTNGEASGSINPDTYKTTIKMNEADGDVQTVSHYQTHNEGAMISQKISDKIADSESSMVIDKRMSREDDIKDMIDLAIEKNKKVKILDVDVPLELSLVRVLQRKIGGEAPNVPFFAVAAGYSEIRKSRSKVLQMIEGNDNVQDYTLNVADETGKSIEVLKKVNGVLVQNEGTDDLLAESRDYMNVNETIDRLANTVITDEYINSYIDRVLKDNPDKDTYGNSIRVALKKYEGKTLKEALDIRANTLNDE
ncbi:MAG: zeta toxin family protein [Candidatus Saccharibacteria bacterium]